MIAAELIRYLLTYDPVTGVFRWRQSGKIAGSVDIDSSGCRRRRIKINGSSYRAAEIAWLYMTGEYPVMSIDHRNQIGDDDSWDNLRLATRSQQMSNRRSWSKHGRGVSKSNDGFIARIQVDKNSVYLGYFATADKAAEAYAKAAELYHGEFKGALQ